MKKIGIVLILLNFLLILSNAQTVWFKHENNPIFPRAGNTWDKAFMAGPHVIYANNLYHMWYQGYNGTDIGSKIGYAYSTDGFDWTRNAMTVLEMGEPGTWDSLSIWSPSVILGDTINYMWYVGLHDVYKNRQIGLAYSYDSVNWVKYEANPVLSVGADGSWDDTWISAPNVHLIDNVFHMWYAGNNGTNTQIGHATSLDGISWEKDDSNPVLSVGEAEKWDSKDVDGPAVLFDGIMYHMWYTGSPSANLFDFEIGYASSSDGLVWTKRSVNDPVLLKGEADTWDDLYVGAGGATVLLNNDSSDFLMWYAGGVDWADGDIGFATTKEPESSVSGGEAALLQMVYPNPVNEILYIRYWVHEVSKVNMVLYNILGVEVAHITNELQESGEKIVSFDTSILNSGLYILKINIGEESESYRLTVVNSIR